MSFSFKVWSKVLSLTAVGNPGSMFHSAIVTKCLLCQGIVSGKRYH